MKRVLIILAIILSPLTAHLSPLSAQKEAPDIRHGNRQYNKDNFEQAEVDYRRGMEKNNNSYEAHYNTGNALFRQNKYPEAAEEFVKAAQLIDQKKRQAKGCENISQFRKQPLRTTTVRQGDYCLPAVPARQSEG